jgi:hypothetical protein
MISAPKSANSRQIGEKEKGTLAILNIKSLLLEAATK